MLVLTSLSAHEAPEETLADLLLSTEGDDRASPWFGHPFRLRTATRDGAKITLAFTLSECADILAVLNENAAVRQWLDLRQAGAAGPRKLN